MRIFKFKKPKFSFKTFITFFFLGAFSGYFVFHFFTGKIPSLIFSIGDFRLHIHHWLYSLRILLSNLRYNFLPFPPFSIGFFSGGIFHGIYVYDDWYKILI